MAQLIITRGLPASGKSTRARAWVSEDPLHRAEVNRDSLRDMLHGGFVNNEVIITDMQHLMIRNLLQKGTSVVSSDTNLPQKHVRELARIGWSQGAEVEIWDMTDVPLETCILRNAVRQDKDPLPTPAIQRMYDRFLRGARYPLPLPVRDSGAVADLYVPLPGMPKVDIVDIDGTLAKMDGRGPYEYSKVLTDRPNPVVIDTVRARYAYGQGIIVMSGRPTRDDDGYDVRGDTILWLRKHLQVPFKALHMRAAGDGRADPIVKRELFDEFIRFSYDVGLVLDDRDRVVGMWRNELGLTCAQVDYGDF